MTESLELAGEESEGSTRSTGSGGGQPATLVSVRRAGLAARRCRRSSMPLEDVEQGFGSGPVAVPGGGVEVADRADVDEPAAPGLGEAAHALEVAEGVVGAGRDDAGEAAAAARDGQPAGLLELRPGGVLRPAAAWPGPAGWPAAPPGPAGRAAGPSARWSGTPALWATMVTGASASWMTWWRSATRPARSRLSRPNEGTTTASGSLAASRVCQWSSTCPRRPGTMTSGVWFPKHHAGTPFGGVWVRPTAAAPARRRLLG